MSHLSHIPDRVRAVVEEYCRERCAAAEAAAYERGRAAGRDDALQTIKALSAIAPGLMAPPPPVIPQTILSTPAPVGVEVAVAAVPEEEAVLGTAGFQDALDDLFGDSRWNDLDRQELVRYVMLMVQEELAARGVDPSPVLSLVKTLAECGGGDEYERTLVSLTDPDLVRDAVNLSWEAVPLKNPRGNFRFMAENPETGRRLYGDKAIGVMQRANRDRYKFKPEEAQPFDETDERTLVEHTEAFRKAKESLTELAETLRSGGSVRPGDLVDFQDRIGLLPVADLRALRRQLATSLTKRVRAGKTKADRVAGIRSAFDRLTAAAAAITKAALERAEADGINVRPDPDSLETLIEGEFDGALASDLSMAPNVTPVQAGKKAESPKPPTPKAAEAYATEPPTPAPKPPAQAKPSAPPKTPAYSSYGVGGQPMEGVKPGRLTIGEIQHRSAAKDEPLANQPSPAGGQPQDVPRQQHQPVTPESRNQPDGVKKAGDSPPKDRPSDTMTKGKAESSLEESLLQRYDAIRRQAGVARMAQAAGEDLTYDDRRALEDEAAMTKALDETRPYPDTLLREYRAAEPAAEPEVPPGADDGQGGDGPSESYDGQNAVEHYRTGIIASGYEFPDRRIPDLYLSERGGDPDTAKAAAYFVQDVAKYLPSDEADVFGPPIKWLADSILSGGIPDDPASQEKVADLIALAESSKTDSYTTDPIGYGLLEQLLRTAGAIPEYIDPGHRLSAAMNGANLAARRSGGFDRGEYNFIKQQSLLPMYIPPPVDGAAAWKGDDTVSGLIASYLQTRNPSVLPILADRYEELGAPPEALYLLREAPDMVAPGMWWVTPRPAGDDLSVAATPPAPPPPPVIRIRRK